MRRLLLALALVSFAGCFDPEEPLCAFACGDNNLCPDDYQCLPDGYCHLHGQAGECTFPDASANFSDAGGDLGAPNDGGDMTAPADLLSVTD
jgi:hypothetical protein